MFRLKARSHLSLVEQGFIFSLFY